MFICSTEPQTWLPVERERGREGGREKEKERKKDKDRDKKTRKTENNRIMGRWGDV